MHPFDEYVRNITRRHFFAKGSHLLGTAALAALAGTDRARAALPQPHHAAKAKHVIYLHMVGGPPQMDLYDYKPKMVEYFDKDLPDSIRMGQRLTTMTSGQARFPIAPSKFQFAKYGKCGMDVCELLPWTSKMVDDMCFIRTMYTEAINHEPAITYMQTGNQVTGRPCLGAWASYGLGSLNQNLPTFVVLVAQPTNTEQVQAISARLWSSGYLSGEHAGVSFRSKGDPILYINNPPGVSPEVRRKTLDGLRALNEMNYQTTGDAETETRIAQYEMAYRMQASVPELTDLAKEPESTFKLYGDAAKKPGTFANSVLMARRMVERGVRFVQIYSGGMDNQLSWDGHNDIAGNHRGFAQETDVPIAGLLTDLASRGLLDSTLVIWGGEFGRLPVAQKGATPGRDHNPHAFTVWMAGGGVKGGVIYGATDDIGFAAVENRVSVTDWHATILHLLGLHHEDLFFERNGFKEKLTSTFPARIVNEVLA